MAIQISGNQVKNLAIDTAQLANDSIDADKLDLSANYVFTGQLRAQTPSNPADVTTKQYVDSIVGNGIFWKEPAEAATTANVNLSNPGTSSFDGVTLSSGDRVLVKDQSSAPENGIYVFNGSSSAMTRATDADTAEELQSAAIFVNSGSTFSDQAFVETQTISSLGSDDVAFVRFSGLGIVDAGIALSKSGDTLNVQVDDSSIAVNGSDQLIVKALGVTNAMLAGSIEAGKLAGSIGDGKLNQITTSDKVAGSAVQLNGSGGLENSSGIKISAGGVVEAMIGDEQISSAKLKFEPTTDFLTTNGNDTSFNLSSSVPTGFDDVIVVRNGLILDRVESSPSDADEYTSSLSGNTCTIVFGAAPASTDKVRVRYFGIK